MEFIHLVSVLLYALLLTEAAAGQNAGRVDPSDCPKGCECTRTNVINSVANVDVICSNRNLVAVPEGTFDKTYSLILNKNKITQLRNEAFDGFPRMYVLDLKENAIQNIETGTFKKLILVYLDLSRNQITTIANIEMNVAELILDLNPLVMEEYTQGPIQNTEMVRFSCAECGLSRISKNFFRNFAGAMYMELPRNSIQSIGTIFQNMKLLQRLDLSRNNIATIGSADVLSGYVSFERLNLANNPLQSLNVQSINSMKIGYGPLDISDTPLTCNCQHEDITSWAFKRKIQLVVSCKGSDRCGFCGVGPKCNAPEMCCPTGKCSKNNRCSGAGLATLPGALLILVVAMVVRSSD